MNLLFIAISSPISSFNKLLNGFKRCSFDATTFSFADCSLASTYSLAKGGEEKWVVFVVVVVVVLCFFFFPEDSWERFGSFPPKLLAQNSLGELCELCILEESYEQKF